MYQADNQQSLSFWTTLLILPLFFLIGWTSRGLLQSDVRDMASNFMRAPLFEQRYSQPKLVVPIPASEVVKPQETEKTKSTPTLKNTRVDTI